MALNISYKSFLLFLLISSLIASENAAINRAKDPKINNHKRLSNMAKGYTNKHRFNTGSGVVLSRFKDKSSNTPIKGQSKAGYVLFGYQFTTKIATKFILLKNRTTSKTKTGSLTAKSIDHTISAGIDYNILQWLTLDLSLQSKKGTITTTIPTQTNVNSKSKNIHRTPSISLKMVFKASPRIFFTPSVGFSRAYMHNKSYVDNASTIQPKKKLTLDQLMISTKAAFLYNPIVIPYASLGYFRVLKYASRLRSRNSYNVGAGILLFGGLAIVDWTASKTYKSITSNIFSMNLNIKF